MGSFRALAVAWGLWSTALAEPNTCQPFEAHPQLPIFHIIGNVTGSGEDLAVGYINDCSGIVEHLGVFHVFHQCCQNHWEHVVSTDLMHWTRLPSPIVPNRTDPKQWYDAGGSYDGSVTILPEADGGPVIIYDVIEVGPPPSGLGDDPPTMGVARAADATDPYLVDWIKDPANPIDFDGTAGSSFPSSVWYNEINGYWNLLAHTYRYESPNSSFHVWRRKEQILDHHVADLGGQWFLALPPPPEGVDAAVGAPTHAVNTRAGELYIFGNYSAADETFKQSKSPAISSIDHGPSFSWAAAQWAGNRTMNIGWVGGSSQATHDSLSLLRDVRYDPRILALVSNPLDELAGLRNATIADERAFALAAGDTKTLSGTAANPRAASADVVLSFDVSDASSGPTIATVCTLADPKDPNATGGVAVLVNVTAAAADGARSARAVVGDCGAELTTDGSGAYDVPVLDGEETFDLRILVDRQVVETFVHGGRCVFTQVTGVQGTTPGTSVTISAQTAVAVASARVFSMGCGWTDPAYSPTAPVAEEAHLLSG